MLLLIFLVRFQHGPSFLRIIVVTVTNKEIRFKGANYRGDGPAVVVDEDVADIKTKPSYVRDINLTEIKALCGLFYYKGALNLYSVTTKELFNKVRIAFLSNCIKLMTKTQERNDGKQIVLSRFVKQLFPNVVNFIHHQHVR